LRETMILTFDKGSEEIRSKVYSKTLRHIADNLPDAGIYRFVNNQDLLSYVTAHNFSSVISTNAMPRDTAFLLKGFGLVQILIGIREDLLDICDITIDPLVPKSERYLTGTKYLLPAVLTEVPAKAIADIMGIGHDILTEEVSHNEAEAELVEIAQVCKRLDWDSDFFGVNVGYISCLRLTQNIERHIRRFIRKEKIGMLQYLCNCHDRESVITSEKNGYSFVDMRLTFEQFLRDGNRVEEREHYHVGKGREGDVKKLKEIATGIYKYSRYYFDTNFARDKVVDFYRGWIEKAIHGKFDDYAYVLYRGDEPIGFCSVKKTRKHAAKIGIFGMSPEYNGKGLSTYLLNASLGKLKNEEGVDYVEVVTQGRNYAAQRLYQRCGFLTKCTELWYHKWFH